MSNIREELVLNAAHLVAENGFSTTKVEDITNAAGCAKGTFYTYFKTKEDVLMAYFDEVIGKEMEFNLGRDLGDRSTEEILRENIMSKVSVVEANSDFLKIIKHIEASPKSFSEELVSNVLQKYGNVINFYVELVKRGIARGEINERYKDREGELALILTELVKSIIDKYGMSKEIAGAGEECCKFLPIELIQSYKDLAIETLFKGISN